MVILDSQICKVAWAQLKVRGQFWAKGRVKNVHNPFESNCVNRAIGVPAMILHDFEDAGALSSPGLSARVFTAKLRYAERGAYLVLHWFWESQQIIFAGTHPK